VNARGPLVTDGRGPPGPNVPSTGFDDVLTARHAELVRCDGGVSPLDVQRWRAAAAGEDGWLLDRCGGATIDLGCGPGRFVEALARRGVEALGVDTAVEAIAQCRLRGVPALHADVFARLPREGGWAHVLLADGNLGIGGDPAALLRRAARLLGPGGTVLVELEPGEHDLWRGLARMRCRSMLGLPFPWAAAGVRALPALAECAGLHTTMIYRGRRVFAELVHQEEERAAPTPGGGTGADATRMSPARCAAR